MADNLTKSQRSYCMSRVKGKDTSIEKTIRSELHKRGLRFKKHVKDLPGKPDIVFSKAKVAVFIDGDFWHGYKLHTWEHKLTDLWKEKIKKTRERDLRNFRCLRKSGWKVIRIWGHDVKSNFSSCVERILSAVNENN